MLEFVVGLNNFYDYAFYRNPGQDDSHRDCLQDSVGQVHSVDNIMQFLSQLALLTQKLLEWVSPADGHGCDTLDFCRLSECEQMVLGTIYTTGNYHYLVMSDDPDIVDVAVGSPVGNFDLCFVIDHMTNQTCRY